MSERIDTAELRRLVEAYWEALADCNAYTGGQTMRIMENLRKSRQRLADAIADSALLDELERLEGIVEDLADPEPCRLDHHGYCQEHAWLTTERPCPQRRIAEAEQQKEESK